MNEYVLDVRLKFKPGDTVFPLVASLPMIPCPCCDATGFITGADGKQWSCPGCEEEKQIAGPCVWRVAPPDTVSGWVVTLHNPDATPQVQYILLHSSARATADRVFAASDEAQAECERRNALPAPGGPR